MDNSLRALLHHSLIEERPCHILPRSRIASHQSSRNEAPFITFYINRDKYRMDQYKQVRMVRKKSTEASIAEQSQKPFRRTFMRQSKSRG